MRVWKPDPAWTGEDAFLIGGGASLRGFPFKRLEGHHVIGCNDAFRLGASICPICHFSDAAWWQKSKHDLLAYGGVMISSAPSIKNIKEQRFYHVHREKHGLHDGDRIGWNYSTGAAAINLALLFGARRVFLLGFDLQLVNSQSHWHRCHKKVTKESSFVRFMRGFDDVFRTLPQVFPGREVINVTNGESRLNHFPMVAIPELISQLA